MFNLQDIQNKTIDLVWIDGTFIKLNQPTIKMYQNMENLGDDFNAIKECMVTMLNNNTSSKKFSLKDVDSLSKATFEKLIKIISEFKVEVDEHPNA